MSYQALYRKFRPQTFEEVKGQDAVVTTLKNQIKNDRVGHAYLFTGTRGTGKTSIAKLFAKAVNCESPKDGSPCGECNSCKAIAANASMNVIEMDAASNNSVEDVRQIVDEVSYSPTEGRFKVYIIDEVHMLSNQAFNALLKTLEEPPSYVVFILATTEVHKIPITILSRCQRYDFRRIDIATIAGRMKELLDIEKVSAEDKALEYIAKCADGSMRDALSLLDQCIAFYLGQELTYDNALEVLGAVDNSVFSRLLRCVINNDILSAIHLVEEVVMRGRELTQFASDFTWYMRNLLLVKTSDNIEDVIDVSTEHKKLLLEESKMIEDVILMRYIRIFSQLSGDMRYSTQKRVLLEMAIIKLCRPEMEKDMASVIDRIHIIEEKLEKGLVVAAPSVEGGMVPGGMYPGNMSEPAKVVELPPALPEDVKQVVARWKTIIARSNDGYLKALLNRCRLSVENDKLIIVVDEEGLGEAFKNPEHVDDLKTAINDVMQKDVSFEIRAVEKGSSFENSYADISKHPDVEKLINFEIEASIEDDFEPPVGEE